MNESAPREGSRPPSRRADSAEDEIPTDPAPAESGSEDDAMDHRFAADEEVADGGAAGAHEARTPGMGA